MVKNFREAIISHAELKLAEALRKQHVNFLTQKRLKGKSRRHLIDFFFPPHLVVQVDGCSHKSRKIVDEVQNADLEAKGFVVLRFQDNEIYDNLGTVVDTIKICLR